MYNLRTYDSNISKVPDSTLGLMDGVRKTIKQTTTDSKAIMVILVVEWICLQSI